MNWLVFHFVSGQAFFSGAALYILAGLLSLSREARLRRLSGLCFILGIVAVAGSATWPLWPFDLVCLLSLLGWIVAQICQRWRRLAVAMLCLVWGGAMAWEATYLWVPTPQLVTDRKLAILGDSVTAGLDGDQHAPTWPQLLAAAQNLQVQDLSRMGATVGSTLSRLQNQTIDAELVLIELGGNDVLGTTTAADFDRELDRLLQHLQRPGRQLLLLELPLPPGFQEFGRSQRRLAAKYQVLLIPKREFLAVLAGSDATLDSIHLSAAGHQRMADRVWQWIQPAYQ